MRGVINDVLRWLIGWSIGLAAPLFEGAHRLKIALAPLRQLWLRRRYRLDARAPIQTWRDEIDRAVQPEDGAFAMTSGSTSNPRRVFYPKRRLRAAKWAYVDMFVRCCHAARIRRRSLYVFSSLTSDESLTSLLLEERRLASYLATLQAPYRIQFAAALQPLTSVYGATAVRVWVLALSNPGVLYSTNPSTLSVFFDDLAASWPDHTRLVRDFCQRPAVFSPQIHRIAGRLASRGGGERLARIASSEKPLPIASILPSLEAYICWSGGYLRPFLDRLATHLPRERYQHIPMYSMSTETIETVAHFRGGAVAFLPMARGVCYEFLEDGADDAVSLLRTAGELQAGTAYTIVVSDAFGLKRYQTGDLFLCRGKVNGLPDLEFQRRRGVEYSFTGEKITADQLSIVYARLREECPSLRADDFLTCVPSYPPGEPIPHYKVALVRGALNDDVRGEEIAARADRLLAAINPEYDSKRKSGRLGPIRAVRLTHAELAALVGGGRHAKSWETQFKFLPLYMDTWESRAST